MIRIAFTLAGNEPPSFIQHFFWMESHFEAFFISTTTVDLLSTTTPQCHPFTLPNLILTSQSDNRTKRVSGFFFLYLLKCNFQNSLVERHFIKNCKEHSWDVGWLVGWFIGCLVSHILQHFSLPLTTIGVAFWVQITYCNNTASTLSSFNVSGSVPYGTVLCCTELPMVLL